MENNRNYTYDSVIELNDSQTSSRKYLAKVFTWMFAALLISAFSAYEFAFTNLRELIVSPTGLTGLGTAAMFAPLVFSLVMGFGFNKLSYPVLVVLFVAYAGIMGVSLSILALIYSGNSLFLAFSVSSLVFAIMAIAGYTTQMDLSKFGSILVIGMFAVVGASLINYFVGSSSFEFLISFVGVAVFTGLTAYYVQTLKRIGEGIEYGDADSKKLVIMGAFALYVTFINLFLSLLRFFGRRK